MDELLRISLLLLKGQARAMLVKSAALVEEALQNSTICLAPQPRRWAAF